MKILSLIFRSGVKSRYKKEFHLLHKRLENAMSRIVKLSSVLLYILVFGMSSMATAGTMPAAKPEEVGFSSDRLQRIHELITQADGEFEAFQVTIRSTSPVLPPNPFRPAWRE